MDELRASEVARATNATQQRRFFEHDDLVPLWIAEPYVELAPELKARMVERANLGWYGYEVRPPSVAEAFWSWMDDRHGWVRGDLQASVSPSIATSIGVLVDHFTDSGDGIVLQPPVFTDFKPLVTRSGRRVVRNSLTLGDDGYSMDFDALEQTMSEPTTRFMILCNPHNPVGRAWTHDELGRVAAIAAANDVFVLADEIHADLVFPPRRFVPFAEAARGTGVRWAATHGPIKTFGLAGLCDTLLVSDDQEATEVFRAETTRLHLARTNVFGVAAFETAYRHGGPWLDAFLADVAANVDRLEAGLPDDIAIVKPEATYLAWLDFRALGLDVPELAGWIADAGLALSPGHWFGREGAGFARMTIAASPSIIDEAIERLATAERPGRA